MTDTVPTDCPSIVRRFSREKILSVVRDYFKQFPDYVPSMDDQELCVYAYGKYNGVSVTGEEAKASPLGYYKIWTEDSRNLPYFIGSFFIEQMRIVSGR